MGLLEASPEIMGSLALGFFWIHTLLIVAAAGQELRRLRLLRARLRPLPELEDRRAGLLRLEVVRGAGPQGQIADNRVTQVGRSKGDGTLWFSDAAHASQVYGGELLWRESGGAEVAISVDGDQSGAAWVSAQTRERAAQLGGPEQFAVAEVQAKRGGGWKREVLTSVGGGDCVWIAGTLHRDAEGGWSICAGPDGLLVADCDPRVWAVGRRRLGAAFIIVSLALAGVCTALMFWPPVFGVVSTLGALAGLGYFLGLQPVGVSLAEAMRTPDRAYLRGSQKRRAG